MNAAKNSATPKPSRNNNPFWSMIKWKLKIDMIAKKISLNASWNQAYAVASSPSFSRYLKRKLPKFEANPAITAIITQFAISKL